jgi:hypothetical protein
MRFREPPRQRSLHWTLRQPPTELQSALECYRSKTSSARRTKDRRMSCVLRERFMQTKKARSVHTTFRSKQGRPTVRKVTRAVSALRPGEGGSSKGMLLGYARVSTIDQNLALQRDALAETGCGRIFAEQLSGAVTDRPALRDALEFARSRRHADRVEARPLGALDEAVDRNHRGTAAERHRLSQPDRSPRHDDRARSACFSHVWRIGGIRTQPDPGAHSGGPSRRASWPHGRPAAETHGRRHRGRQGDARQSRYRRDANRAPPWRLSRGALSLHPRRANRECPGRLRTALYPQNRTPREGLSAGARRHYGRPNNGHRDWITQ